MKVEVSTIEIGLTADCACGGQMVQVNDWRGRPKLEWRCSRSHWWNRRRGHTYLAMELQISLDSNCTPSAPPHSSPDRPS